MSLAAAQSVRLQARLAAELADWRARVNAPSTDKKGWAWSFHRSQVEATADVIEAMLAAPGPDVVTGATLLWDWFSAGFSQRFDAGATPLLHLVDLGLFAWYNPIKRRSDRRDDRTPPLTLLSEQAVPEASPRGESFLPAFPSIVNLATNTALRKAILKMPVPIVRVPRLYAWDLAVVGVVAHEVGHLVGHEFGLLDAVSLDAADIPDDRRAAWSGWLEEAWCDAYGAHCLGPAYTIGLAHFLDGTSASDASYPSPRVRLALQRQLLLALGSWVPALDAVCPLPDGDHAADTPAVARTLLDTVFPAKGGAFTLATSGVRPFDSKLLAQARAPALRNALSKAETLPQLVLDTPADVLLAASPLLALESASLPPSAATALLSAWSRNRPRETRAKAPEATPDVARKRAIDVLSELRS